ncbi:hypothetical protein CY34DRAFT_813378, partial [Suillus luteus UH-Slu-Lm8-n1]
MFTKENLERNWSWIVSAFDYNRNGSRGKDQTPGLALKPLEAWLLPWAGAEVPKTSYPLGQLGETTTLATMVAKYLVAKIYSSKRITLIRGYIGIWTKRTKVLLN